VISLPRPAFGPDGALTGAIAAARGRKRARAAAEAVFAAWGYEEVVVPVLQPADEVGADGGDWGGVYRVLDQDGALYALRPDMTVPIARLVALGDPAGPRPRRLCYFATLFRRGGGDALGYPGGPPREVEQAGAELIGASGPAADAEVLALAVETLRAAGVATFRLAVGHVAVLGQMLAAAGCSEAEREAALASLRRRDLVALEAALARRRGLLEAVTWRGPLRAALEGAAPWARTGAGEEFSETLALVADLGLGDAVAVEMGLVRPGSYYTGLVFEVSAPGVARPLGGGGRYDGLLGRWGRDEPATGFALDLAEVLSAAGPSEAGAASVLVTAEPGCERLAWRTAAELRSAGVRAVLGLGAPGDDEVRAAGIGCREVWRVGSAGVTRRPCGNGDAPGGAAGGGARKPEEGPSALPEGGWSGGVGAEGGLPGGGLRSPGVVA
jgi:ATP phosphoribosyltransferase regulatory subunit